MVRETGCRDKRDDVGGQIICKQIARKQDVSQQRAGQVVRIQLLVLVRGGGEKSVCRGNQEVGEQIICRKIALPARQNVR